MALSFIAKTIVPIAGVLIGENYFLRTKAPTVYLASAAFPIVSKAYGAVLLVNVIATGFLLVFMGASIGAARTKFIEKAKKEGDKDAEARFAYPKMYAEGFSKEAKQFNCMQRGHQQPLETYTMFVAMSVIGGLKFPIATLCGGVLWMYARIKWAEGYSSGEPSKRYQSWVSYGIWSSLVLVAAAAISTAVTIVM
jgi:glutathione S-transferase